MKISKHLRDDAATICAVCASEPIFLGAARASAAFGFRFDAIQLACHAWMAAARSMGIGDLSSPIYYAEAEALLRTGWTP